MRTITQPISRSAALLVGSLLLTPALLLGSADDARGAPVFTFDANLGGSGNIKVDQSLGWTFDVIDPITVIGLGWFDENRDGLAMAHTVGLWDPEGVPLLGEEGVIVPAGVAAALDGAFRTVFFAEPIRLEPGSGYVIGGANFASNPERIACGLSDQCDGSLDPIFDPRISFGGANFSDEPGLIPQESTPEDMNPPPHLRLPSRVSTVTGEGFYGASFSVVPIPEPSTAPLLGGGLLGLAICGTRRSKKPSRR